MAHQKNLAVVGCGNMGSAFIRAIHGAWKPGTFVLHACDPHESKLALIADEIPGVKTHTLLKDLPEPDLLVLATKPQDFRALAPELDRVLSPTTTLVSILAGQTLASLTGQLPRAKMTVRAMPNICARVAQSATALAPGANLSEEAKSLVEETFQALGEFVWTSEHLLDAVTGLSGSGPAYIFLVIEALTDGGVKMGLPRAIAKDLATQTVLGAATLLQTSGSHPAALKDQVTTPGGTTIHALHELERKGIRSMFIDAVEIATERSKKLGTD